MAVIYAGPNDDKMLMSLREFFSPVTQFFDRSPASRARQLAEAGQYRAAIDLLADEDADALDLGTLRDIVKWRNAAFVPGAPRADWPPALPDPFPGLDGVPEIHGSELTSAILGGAIQHHGALLVRGLIAPEQAAELVKIVDKGIDTIQTENPGQSPWFSPYPVPPDYNAEAAENFERDRNFVNQQKSLWTADSPRALADLIAFLKAHGVGRAIEEYLGEPVFLSLKKSTLRRVPPDTFTAWHQDGAFLGADCRTVNCWLALSECGDGEAPGLDVYPRRVDRLVETGTRGAFDWWVIGDGVADDLIAETVPATAPRFKAGDAILFDHLCLHRTGARPNLKRPRLAIESWFFAGSTFPMDQIPIAL